MTPKGGLSGFAGWLRQRRLAPEHRIPHLERLVQRFLRFAGVRPSEPWQDSLRIFMEELDQGRTPDWQIRQAADAVRAYTAASPPGGRSFGHGACGRGSGAAKCAVNR